ncbi:unnamed protein product [Periconia digitata]|uniref:DUF7580 domain-containing protein n=1 Tax=Periconia digitata TaxID=1303443 RepID=A0A9W4U6L6_9PLEO|nr:unnamed protein product [Periconia digitata]
MVTGVEIAGLVLGSIPLIMKSLEFYTQGIATTKRFFRYHEQFQNLIRELSTENAVYINTLNILLVGVVKNKDMPEFLSDPCGKRWKDDKFDQKLKQRLGASHDPFMRTLGDLVQTIEKFKQMLKLDPGGNPRFNDKNSFKKYYKALAFSLQKSDYDSLMNSVRRSTESLERITKQTKTLESLQLSSKDNKRQAPNFKKIKTRAQALHSSLCAGWNCKCHSTAHVTNLRLEPRINVDDTDDSDASDDDGRSMSDPFHVVFRNHKQQLTPSAAIVASLEEWAWEEADVHITFEKQTTKSATQNSKKGVHFTKEAKKSVSVMSYTESETQRIQSLCTAIRTLQQSQRATCLSLSGLYERECGILLYPVKKALVQTEAWSMPTLQAVLKDPAFSRKDRIQLAVTLASSTLQLHDSPWLDDSWTKDDIMFIKRSDKTVYDHAFIPHRLATEASPAGSLPPAIRSIIRNQTLYRLGVTLIELWYGKSISELEAPGDDSQMSSFLTEFNTADRLVSNLYNDAGKKYANAVRRCIRCEFDHHVTTLENTAFQQAVYQGVVAQLKENFDFLHS